MAQDDTAAAAKKYASDVAEYVGAGQVARKVRKKYEDVKRTVKDTVKRATSRSRR